MQGEQQADARQELRVCSCLVLGIWFCFVRVYVPFSPFKMRRCDATDPPVDDRTRQGGVWALQMNSGSPTSVARYHTLKQAIVYICKTTCLMRKRPANTCIPASNPVTEGDAGKTNKGPPPAKNTQKKKMTVVRKVDAIRNRGMSAGEVDAGKLDKAFTAFADTLLQKKGRVRFYRINEGFRR
jgi:hypothetical protein